MDFMQEGLLVDFQHQLAAAEEELFLFRFPSSYNEQLQDLHSHFQNA